MFEYDLDIKVYDFVKCCEIVGGMKWILEIELKIFFILS